jgi:hypothetical protein
LRCKVNKLNSNIAECHGAGKRDLILHNFLKLNIQDIFITFAACYKLRSTENGKEKNPLYFTRNFPLFT